MKLSISCLILAAAAQYDDGERGKPDHGPNFCNGKSNQLKKTHPNGGVDWKCNSRQNKNKGDSKKCKGKCKNGGVSTAPKKVRCDEGVGWMTKKRGYANWSSTMASCCTKGVTATCDFTTGEGNNGAGTIQGALKITQYTDCGDGMDRVTFVGRLTGDSSGGFTAGKHGLHVHDGTDHSGGCGDLGGHFTVLGTKHGSPMDSIPDRHEGDLGNIRVSSNKEIGDVWVTDMIVSLDASHDNFIGGRGMVLHELEDQPTEQPTGAAGSRVGCCIIVMD